MTQVSPKELYTHTCTRLACHVNSQLMRDLPDTMEALAAIKKLDFSRSMLGRSDVEPLVQAILRHCTGLQVLNLSQNYLTDDSVVQICEALLANTLLLVSLDLSNNPISNKTGRYLLRFIESMPALKYVGVHKTLMNDSMLRLFPHPSNGCCPSVAGSRTNTFATAASVSTPNMASIGKDSQLGSVRGTAKEDIQYSPQKLQWPALETLWRAAAVAAPTKNKYSGLGTLVSSTRVRRHEIGDAQRLHFSPEESSKGQHRGHSSTVHDKS
ncbi:putative calpain-like cysteine peptidase [Trypanosoma conorhini]|uniref:Putative calpain-like cysteine peptidase n=1 Tax=Trypanosoma conorhini TaxID=83891 RepID=A0A422Q7I5_9TRYP|nr:putative calpain-like cysteine peptidase [Trypanosoma conorhini]RNF25919.1 putative calpain-like cysteine peptidase [Trypanosoma conorhini]